MTIQSICSSITNLINAARTPMNLIPGAIIACSCIIRPGLSPMLIASNIIRRQSEAGAPFGAAADGSANVAEAMERIRVEEMVKALKMDALVQTAIPIGGIQFSGVGINKGGPVVVKGFNTNAPRAIGLIG